MKTNKVIINFIKVIVIISFIFGYRLYFSGKNYIEIYNSNIKDEYKDKYYELLNTYNFIEENYEFIPAKVLNGGVNKLNNIFLINKGRIDNVKNNSYVVNEEGLIGEIIKVYKNYSVVRMITSSNINIAVEINECFGTLKKKKNEYVIEDLINCDDVKKNDAIFTSKYNYSSSNILVGNIKKIKNNTIYVKYNFNPYKIHYLGVINDTN